MNVLEEVKAYTTAIGSSVLFRMLFLGFLIMILQIPILQIDDTIREREDTRAGAMREVTETWGGVQSLAGPVLVVPYLERWRDKDEIEHANTHYTFFQPEELKIDGAIDTEVRHRGIFDVPLYLAKLRMTGRFARPDLSAWGIAERDILWSGATLVVGISEPRALREQVDLTWNGDVKAFEPGREIGTFVASGIHVPGIFKGGAPKEPEFTFAVPLVLGGADRLDIVPVGRDTEVALRSPWPDPSFTGAYLPTAREVGPGGFTATWKVPHLGRNYPQSWRDAEVKEQLVQASFGVAFFATVDAYTAVTRSVKYELLFVFMTFLVFFLFELFYRLKVHPVQYLLVGFAMCIFYLLLLALSEHVGFDLAYAAAGAAVVALIGGYSSVILGKKLGALVAGELAVLYGFLYTLLQVEDYALLVGAVGLFVVLAVVMFVTRRVDWYRIGQSAARPASTLTSP
jgi:inner membrane protein